MNMLENVDLYEMQTLRSDVMGLFYEFFKVGRQAMENPEKKEQLQRLLGETRAELSKIADDNQNVVTNNIGDHKNSSFTGVIIEQ